MEFTVRTQDLIEKLKINRDEHRDIFEKAQVRFRQELIRLLDERLDAAKRGHKVPMMIQLPEPEDYTSSYDSAIEALGWEVNDTVILSQDDFNRLVLNRWEWANRWAGSTASYLVQ